MVASTPQSQNSSSRGRGGNRGRGWNSKRPRSAAGRQAKESGETKAFVPPLTREGQDQTSEALIVQPVEPSAIDDSSVCWICAESVKYYAISECDHRTCHVCTLRLRALYKKTDCTFCKNPQASVIFTASPDASFADFTPERIPYKDPRLSIFFETEEMREETFMFLRYNCPDSACEYIATGWGDLKLHTRAVHMRTMCDLCVRSKKVFSHEHTLYTAAQLAIHLPSMSFRMRRSTQKDHKDIPEGDVHPLCEFCRGCFFDADELYSHMREKHEECFLCKRNNIRDQYFSNYDNLEKHFHDVHHPCLQPQCLGHKFIVFDSALDLKAHMVEQHAAGMSSRDKKDVRKIQADFEFEGAGSSGRTRRGRERENTSQPQNAPSNVNMPMSRPMGTSRRMEGFGAALTFEASGNAGSNVRPERAASPEVQDNDSERLLSLTARLHSLTANSPNALRAIEAAIRSYVSSESAARDLISTLWNISDRKLEDTASAVNAILDVLDDEDKKRNLLGSWNGFKIEERRQFPDLTPTGVGTGYAEITSGRVLNAKNRMSQQSSRQVLDRVARVASSSAGLAPHPKPPDIFPPLQSSPGPAPAFQKGQRKTPWTSSASSTTTRGQSIVVATPTTSTIESRSGSSGANTGPQPRRQPPPPKFSEAAFPELPSSSTARSKLPVVGNASVRNIIGDTPPIKSAWGSGGSNVQSVQNANSVVVGESGMEREVPRGKKAKGKQKQTLFTLGSMPT